MKIQFFKLLTMTIMHTYYREHCRDFTFIVPSDSAQLLKDGKLLAKEVDGRFIVLFEADGDGNSLASVAGRKLRIGLALRNSHFGNISELGPGAGMLTPIYRNGAGASDLYPEDSVLVGNIFSLSLSDKTRPVLVSLNDANGFVLQCDSITTADNRTEFSCDLTSLPAASYSISEIYPERTATTFLYHDAELQPQRPFGIVEIEISKDFYTLKPKPLAPEMTIMFSARLEALKYYVVANGNTNTNFFDKLTIADSGFSEEKRDEVVFDRVPGNALGEDDLSADLLGEIPGNILLFKSRDKVARREAGRKKIQLVKNGDVLISNLPQPAADKVKADIVIQISR